MGRLQKKKPANVKKKKKMTASAEAGDSARTDGGAPSAGLTVVPGKDVKKKSSAARKSHLPARTATGSQKKNVFQTSIQFLREVRIELKKVVWPSKKQTMGSTVVVIALVLIISAFLGVIDIGLTSLIQAVLN